MKIKIKIRSSILALFFAVLWLAAGSAFAQDYPNKPIRFVAPGVPGGNTDYLARLIGQKLSETWGKPVVIDNRPGATGNIGTNIVAKAAPDGYTILLAWVGTHAVNPHMFHDLPYDPVKDFEAITQLVSYDMLTVVNLSVPAKSLKELVALAKSNPGKLNFGTSGIGSTAHLYGELLKMNYGINLVHVPYKGSAPAITDLLGGRIEVMFDVIRNVQSYIEAGRLRALAIANTKRSPVFPNLPTVIEAGFPDMLLSGWYGILAPAKTPKAIVNKLNHEIVKILQTPDVRDRLTNAGFEVKPGTPEEFTSLLYADLEKYGKIIKACGARFQ